MPNELARLVVPALRWDRAHGFRYLEGLIDDALELGVGGFFIESGPQGDVVALIGRLHAESRHPLLIAARAESGAGQQIGGLTHLPPFGALASVAVVNAGGAPSLNPEPVRRAARLTARELRSVGGNWALAPNCEAAAGVQTAGDDPAVVAAVVGEWVDACQAEAVVATAMSFRGKPSAPISAAIDAGVSCVAVAHDDSAKSPMVSSAAIENTLRTSMHFDALVSTVPFEHERAITPANESALAVAAVAAGCDIVLAPGDLNGVADALARAATARTIPEARTRTAIERATRWSGWARPGEERQVVLQLSLDDLMWSRQVADAGVQLLRGSRPRIGASVEVVKIGLFTEGTDPFESVLRSLHIDVRMRGDSAAGRRDPLVVLFTPGGDQVTRDEAHRITADVSGAQKDDRDVVVVAFCHPRAAVVIAGAAALVAAWEPSRPMQEAAARAMFSRGRGSIG